MEPIRLNQRLFTEEPDALFSKKRNVQKGLLDEMYYRYIVKGYTPKDLQEYYEIKTKRKPIDRKNLCVWLKRIEVYRRAKIATDMGAKTCLPAFFGDNAEFVSKHIYEKYKTNALNKETRQDSGSEVES